MLSREKLISHHDFLPSIYKAMDEYAKYLEGYLKDEFENSTIEERYQLFIKQNQ